MNKNTTRCPMCNGVDCKATNQVISTAVAKYKMWLCRYCSSEFAVPRLGASVEYYNYTKPAYRWEFGEVCSFINKVGIHTNILDLGCGDGSFIDHLNKNGVEAYGIDFNEKDIETARRRGLNCECQDLVNLPAGGGYCVITAFHVIEHVEDPFQLIKDIRSKISNNGFLFLSFPNVNRYDLHFRRDEADYPPNHLSRISDEGLKLLVKRLGMEVLWSRTESYNGNWLFETSLAANNLIDRLKIRRFIRKYNWLNFPIKVLAFFISQPLVIFSRIIYTDRQGYTNLYCMKVLR